MRAHVIGALLLGACSVSGVGRGLATSASSADEAAGDADDADDADEAQEMKTRKDKLPDGIPGAVCDAEGLNSAKVDYDYDGPCWNPPGFRIAAPMPTGAIRGRRAITGDGVEAGASVWWFEMPEGQLNPSSQCVKLQGMREQFWEVYEPYLDDGGFPKWTVPDWKGRAITDVLDEIDAKNMPACVTVVPDTSCELGTGKICSQSLYAGDPVADDGGIRFLVGSDIKDEGTADEQRRYPEVVNRKLDEVLADLKARGFDNVKVVEDTVSCERGIVCEAEPSEPRSGFVGTHEEIRLIVRRAKASH